MNVLKIIIISGLVVFLSACHEDEPFYPPELLAFHVVDSYGVNSEFEPDEFLSVSPYIDDGAFEINWSVRHHGEAYRTRFYLNDRNSPFGGILVSSNRCGPGRACNRDSYQYCYYTDDFLMGCERPESSEWEGYVDIAELILDIPETLYFVFEVCDLSDLDCEYSTRRVRLE